jgi:GntR family transcriptional regulator/MocR family aminotransferase
LYRQLHQLLQAAILSGALPSRAKLPSSRLLSAELGIARNTVTQVFEQLMLEGYLVATSGRGTFVSEGAREDQSAEPAGQEAPTVPSTLPNLSERGRRLYADAVVFERQPGAFMPGVPDLARFPTRTWNRLQKKHWQRSPEKVLNYAPPGGHARLRSAISDYLHSARSVRCSPSQVIVTTSNHQSIDLAIQLLTDVGDLMWIEDPSYWGTRNVLQASGLALKAIPVDDDGIAPSKSDMATPPKLILVTPTHHYPLGMEMSIRRRKMLLGYADEHNCWIIEDDCNSEFKYGTKQLPSLQGMDGTGKVLYIGSFSSSLFPGVRIGYIVVPTELAQSFAIASTDLDREGQELHQAVLADFLDEGFFASHVRRMRVLYKWRRELLILAINERYGNQLRIAGGDVGLHLTLLLPSYVDDKRLVSAAHSAGILMRPLSSYFMGREESASGVLLGYACVSDTAIHPAFNTFADILDRFLDKTS